MTTVDLSSCDREPIHQLGLIQPFGALLAVTADWVVAFRSANCAEIVHPRQPIELGDKLAGHLSAEALALLRDRAAQASRMDVVERIFGIDLLGDGARFDVALHASGPFFVIEIEPNSDGATGEYSAALRPVMDSLRRCQTTQALCDAAAEELKRMLGFDRVMVYRFHDDESGEVMSEARESHLESYLTLRYPRSDIPQQARRLYLRNLFRIISDVNAEPVPIEPVATPDDEPLDLSLSTLRAVSSIHIEYLLNMGVGASLSISIVVEGKLWGLFACHHYSPRVLPFSQRTAAELFAQLFSLQLELSIKDAGAMMRERANRLHDRLLGQLVGGKGLADNLHLIEEAIAEIIPHDGLSAYIDESYRTCGTAPTQQQFEAIAAWLNNAPTSTIVHSDQLAALVPEAEAFADKVVGALVIPVSRRARDYVVLWRRELPQVVTWGGNPDKVAQVGPNGDRLTPRKSFAAWQESVRGRGDPWTGEERAVAERLRVTLLEVILRITDEQMQERMRAQERQELLIAELNHRVRNILTLIRSLIGQSRGEVTDTDQFIDLVSGRVQALAMAHDHITRENWSSASLKALIEAEAEAYLAGKGGRITVTGKDVLVAPEAYTVLALVIHEMMTNSAKYGSLCDRSGKLEIAIAFTNDRELCLAWRESGGPPVKAPKRRGFGSTIIEKSIPHELKGTADVRYKVSGLEADFCIPARYAEPVKDGVAEPVTKTGDDARSDARKVADAADREGVLLVEDNMIIAMDAEETLRMIGFAKVAVSGSVEGAMRELDAMTPRLALLDYNLGDATSEEIARRLTAEGVPFWFVTGYGDAVEQLSESDARGVLQKPYTRQDLERVVASLDED